MQRTAVAMASVMLLLAGCQRGEQAASNTSPPSQTPVTPGLPSPTTTPAASAGPALSQAMDTKGELRLDVTEAVRTGGVLTLKARFTLTSGKPGSRPLPGGSTSDVYLTAGDKKYLLLKDDHDKELMSSNYYPDFDHVGASQTWWGKFPAPGTDVKAVNFYFNGFEPAENVAITDR